MAAVVESPPGVETLADLLDQLGGISPDRVRIRPPLGTATVDDLIEISRREGRLFELVDGVLVEKAMGYRESGFWRWRSASSCESSSIRQTWGL